MRASIYAIAPVVITVFAVGQTMPPAVDAEDVFAGHCASCHGLDGRARTPAGKKLLAKDLSESKLSDAEIVGRILEGLSDKKGSSRMPAFKDHLSAA